MNNKLDQLTGTNEDSYAKVLEKAVINAKGSLFPQTEPKPRIKTIAIMVEKKEQDIALSGETIRTKLLVLPIIRNGDVSVDIKCKPHHVILITRSASESDKIKGILSAENYKVKTVGDRLPQIVIPNVRTEDTEQQILSFLLKQNPEVFEDTVAPEIVATKLNKQRNTKTYILKVGVTTAKRFERGRKVFLPGQFLNCVLDDQILQCFNCRRLGHTSARCERTKLIKSTGTMCPKCGIVHLETQPCKDPVCCSNCKMENESRNTKRNAGKLPTDHASNDFRKCPLAKKMKENIRIQVFGSIQ